MTPGWKVKREILPRDAFHAKLGGITKVDVPALYLVGQTIVNLEGSGEHSRLQVAFQGQGIKWLVAAYARLETV